MEQHPISELMSVTMSKIKEMVDVNTVVGDPITTHDGIMVVPISRVSLGFGSGGSDFSLKEGQQGFGGGNGAGITITPIGFLVINDGNVRMLNIAPPASSTVDRLVELIPDVLDRVQDFVDSRKGEED